MRKFRKMTWVLLLGAVLLAGCGGDEAADEEAAANQGEMLPEPEPEQPLSVGDAATVIFGPLDEGAVGELKVTLTDVVDPYTPPPDDLTETQYEPTEGTRFVNLRFDVANVEERPYADDLYGAGELVLSDGQIAEGLTPLGACEDTIALEANIPPRAKITDACDIYEVPEGLEPARYVISDDGAVMAEWSLGESPKP